MIDRCKGYCGVSCVDGSCPRANIEEYIEYGIPVVRKCSDCSYYKGCEDCAFLNTEYCIKEIENEKKLIDSQSKCKSNTQ